MNEYKVNRNRHMQMAHTEKKLGHFHNMNVAVECARRNNSKLVKILQGKRTVISYDEKGNRKVRFV